MFAEDEEVRCDTGGVEAGASLLEDILKEIQIHCKLIFQAGEDQMIAGRLQSAGGKSELRRAGWSLTATGGDPKESATENIPPVDDG